MNIAILSDTHIPDLAERLSDQFRDHIKQADLTIHGGDFGSKEAYHDVRKMGNKLIAVYGNADPAHIDLPPVASVTVGGASFVISHGIVNFVQRAVSSSEGVVFDRADWLDAIADTARARADIDEPLVGVGGHSHEVVDEIHEGVRVLNPGSATGVGPADGRETMMTAEVAKGEIDITIHEV